jgi:hypothetical protein
MARPNLIPKRPRKQPATTNAEVKGGEAFIAEAALATQPSVVRKSDPVPGKVALSERKNFRFSPDEIKLANDVKVRLMLASREDGEILDFYENEIVRLGLYLLEQTEDANLVEMARKLPRGRKGKG